MHTISVLQTRINSRVFGTSVNMARVKLKSLDLELQFLKHDQYSRKLRIYGENRQKLR